jgi:hypothetical protein
MATFHQQGQKVNHQYNADTIHLGPLQNAQDWKTQVELISSALETAISQGHIQELAGRAAKAELQSAASAAASPHPKKAALTTYLTKAQKLLGGITAAEGLAEAIKQLIHGIGGLFP